MKTFKSIILFILLAIVIGGCAQKEASNESSDSKSLFDIGKEISLKSQEIYKQEKSEEETKKDLNSLFDNYIGKRYKFNNIFLSQIAIGNEQTQSATYSDKDKEERAPNFILSLVPYMVANNKVIAMTNPIKLLNEVGANVSLWQGMDAYYSDAYSDFEGDLFSVNLSEKLIPCVSLTDEGIRERMNYGMYPFGFFATRLNIDAVIKEIKWNEVGNYKPYPTVVLTIHKIDSIQRIETPMRTQLEQRFSVNYFGTIKDFQGNAIDRRLNTPYCPNLFNENLRANKRPQTDTTSKVVNDELIIGDSLSAE